MAQRYIYKLAKILIESGYFVEAASCLKLHADMLCKSLLLEQLNLEHSFQRHQIDPIDHFILSLEQKSSACRFELSQSVRMGKEGDNFAESFSFV